MKKITILLTSLVLITSCREMTTKEQDMQMIQHKNPNSIVYRIDAWNYVSCDSSNVYHITMTRDGKIKAKIRIK